MQEGPHVETTPESEQGSQQAADLAELEAMAGGESEQAQESAPEAPKVPTTALLAPLVAMLCNIAAPAWNISVQEQEALTGAYAAVVDKYFPDGVSMGPELGALIVTAAILGPRWHTPRHIEPPKEEEEKRRPPVTLQEAT